MDKETQKRHDAAPQDIYVEVKQQHIDEFKGVSFGMSTNPVAAALAAAGFPEASIGLTTAFIGNQDGLVAYVPEGATTIQMQDFKRNGKMTPFIAKFTKEKN